MLSGLFSLELWVDFARFLTAMFDATLLRSLAVKLSGHFTAAGRLVLLFFGNAVDALIDFAVFSTPVFSPGLIVERGICFMTAMVPYVPVVMKNPRFLLVWTGVIGACVALCVATGLIAPPLILPVLGYASWSMHRLSVASQHGSVARVGRQFYSEAQASLS